MITLANVMPRRRVAGREPVTPLGPPTGRQDHRALWVVASVGLIAASIAAFAGMYASAGHKVPAIVVVRSLAQGQLITGADVGPADVSVSAGVEYIALAQSGRLVGKRAAAAIAKGSLLTMADLSTAPAINDGEAVVGIALKVGAYPAGGLSPGDEVMVVQTASPGAALAAPLGMATASSAGPFDSVVVSGAVASTTISGAAQSGTGILVARAPVTSVAVPATGSTGGYSMVVSVEVTSADAAAVATAAAAGQASIVLLGSSSGSTASTTSTTSPARGPS